MKKYITITALVLAGAIFNGCTKTKQTERLENCGTDAEGHKLYYEESRGCYYLLPYGDKFGVAPSECKCKTPYN